MRVRCIGILMTARRTGRSELCWSGCCGRQARPGATGRTGAPAARRARGVALRRSVLQKRAAGAHTPLGQAAFPILDEYEDEDWERREAGRDPLDDQAAAAAARDADFLARLLLACGNDSAVLPDVVMVWYETRRKPFDASGDEDRANHYLSSFLRLVNSYGNLFGRFRETVPAFDPIKAADGRRRRWRD